ncbi:hypothetical protein EYF80_004553 [Liparis tanakae]|uniref:Uncharacterized protein n=1 Tax=Liparis tanakae TaxID=230148 RepID=A0A4Z2J6M5_9TELE|nr:hypothetical protein EYF80_004553 [Liparis tanakae]
MNDPVKTRRQVEWDATGRTSWRSFRPLTFSGPLAALTSTPLGASMVKVLVGDSSLKRRAQTNRFKSGAFTSRAVGLASLRISDVQQKDVERCRRIDQRSVDHLPSVHVEGTERLPLDVNHRGMGETPGDEPEGPTGSGIRAPSPRLRRNMIRLCN